MGVLLHISDTHFGTEQAPVVEALVALAAQQRPDVVVLSGDITQRARPAQFRAAQACVERLGAPVLAIPGNHDIALFDLWARLTRPYARLVFGADPEPVHASPDWLVVGSTTTRARRHRHGEVSAAQIERVARLLASASPRQLRVVVVHQPVRPCHWTTSGTTAAWQCASHTGMGRRRCRPGCWAATSTCPSHCRWTDWRGGCGRCRRARLLQRARGLGCPIRSTSCAGVQQQNTVHIQRQPVPCRTGAA